MNLVTLMSRAFPTLAVTFAAGCATAPAELTAQPPGASAPNDALLVSFEGPYEDLEARLARRTNRSEDCDPNDDVVPPNMSSSLDDGEPNTPILDLQIWTYESDLVCAVVRMCTVAIRTEGGWWLQPASEDRICEGMTGPSTTVRALPAMIDRGDRGEVFVRRAFGQERRTIQASRETGERTTSTEYHVTPEFFACAARADGLPTCQRAVPYGGTLDYMEELTLDLEGMLDDGDP